MSSQSPRLAILGAVVFGIIGVGLIASGVVMVLRDGGGSTSATTTGATPTVTTGAPGTTAPTPPPATTVATTAIEFVTLTDETGTITLEAPVAWADVATGPWDRDGVDIGPSLSAAVDIDAWIEGWDTPGLFVGVSDQMGIADALGGFGDSCQTDRTEPITVSGAVGVGEWWWWCGEAASSFFVGVIVHDDGSLILFQILDSPTALPVVVEHVLGSFRYTG